MCSLIRFAVALFFLCNGFAWGDLIVKDGEKIVFMGDSITELGWKLPGGYVKLTVAGLQTLGVKVVPIPAGIGGQTSRDMVARVTTDVVNQKPDWLTLSCGVNDVWHGTNGCTLDEYKKNITSIVDQAQAAHIKVLLMTSTLIGEDDNENNKKLIAYNDFLHQLAAQRHLPVADEGAAFQADLKDPTAPRPLTMDGVHPNPNGAQILARTLLATFGASPAQIATVGQAWLDMPESAWAQGGCVFNVQAGLTMRQLAALDVIAASHKMSTQNFLASLFLQALGPVLQAHSADPVLDFNTIQDEARVGFKAKVAELASRPLKAFGT